MKNRLLKSVFEVLLMLAGSAALALSYNLFLMPNKIVPGGVGGLSMLLNHLLGVPVGLTMIALNGPIFAMGIKVLGKSYGLRSLVGLLVSSLLVDFFTYVVPLPVVTTEPLLACLFGGLMLGAGLGLVFRTGASTGGIDIVAQVLAAKSNLTTGSAILLLDFTIISLAGLVYGNFELALFGYVSLYVQTRAVDLVIEGVSYTRALFIVSDRASEIAELITRKLGRGATLLTGQGAFTDRPHTLVFSVMTRRQAQRCRRLVLDHDPHAFVTITDVYDVQGEGFHPRTPADLPGA